MATAYEMSGNRDATIEGDAPEWTLNFCVIDATDEYEAQTAILAIAPAELYGLTRTAIRQPPKIKYEGGTTWTASIKYVIQELGTNPDPSGFEITTYTVEFDTGGETFTNTAVKASAQTKYSWSDGAYPAPDIKGGLGFDGKESKGIQQVIPGLKLTLTADFNGQRITPNVIKSWSRATGKTNADVFLGFAAGELLNLGCRGSVTIDAASGQGQGRVPVSFVFQASENITTAQTIGEINIPSKGGWQHIDVVHKDYDDGSGTTVHKPFYAYVSTVYQSTSFRSITGIR